VVQRAVDEGIEQARVNTKKPYLGRPKRFVVEGWVKAFNACYE